MDETLSTPSAAERFESLWLDGPAPDLDAFVAGAGLLSAAELAAVVHVDQERRWRGCEPLSAESYLHKYPSLACDGDAGVDVIYHEFLLREAEGDIAADDVVARFPAHAAT